MAVVVRVTPNGYRVSYLTTGGAVITGGANMFTPGQGSGAGGDGPSGVELFTTPGADAFTFPDGAEWAIVQVWGGGGGGGDQETGDVSGGGGGGGGGYVKALYLAGDDLDIVVGGGGQGPQPSGDGAAGQDSTVTQGTGVCTATGGGGGIRGGVEPGAGGAGGSGTVVGAGVTELLIRDGEDGTVGGAANGGAGGRGAFGGGAGGAGGVAGVSSGGAGAAPAGGGGGGPEEGFSRGAGARGQVRVTWGSGDPPS